MAGEGGSRPPPGAPPPRPPDVWGGDTEGVGKIGTCGCRGASKGASEGSHQVLDHHARFQGDKRAGGPRCERHAVQQRAAAARAHLGRLQRPVRAQLLDEGDGLALLDLQAGSRRVGGQGQGGRMGEVGGQRGALGPPAASPSRRRPPGTRSGPMAKREVYRVVPCKPARLTVSPTVPSLTAAHSTRPGPLRERLQPRPHLVADLDHLALADLLALHVAATAQDADLRGTSTAQHGTAWRVSTDGGASAGAQDADLHRGRSTAQRGCRRPPVRVPRRLRGRRLPAAGCVPRSVPARGALCGAPAMQRAHAPARPLISRGPRPAAPTPLYVDMVEHAG